MAKRAYEDDWELYVKNNSNTGSGGNYGGVGGYTSVPTPNTSTTGNGNTSATGSTSITDTNATKTNKKTNGTNTNKAPTGNKNNNTNGSGSEGNNGTPTANTTPLPAEDTQIPESSGMTPEVYDAQMALEALRTNKPEGYNSKYAPQMELLLEQINNPDKFKWDFNGDELFKSYADLYAQNGLQASMDVMGQAAALTGGYGNSYAQQVGNQAYDEWLRALYDKGLEFRDRSYEQWLNEQQDLYNRYGLLQNADDTDYGRYRDEIADWMNELNFNENVRQFNESLDWEKMSAEQEYAAKYALSILAAGQMPSAAMLKAAGLSEEDAAKLMAKKSSGGGGKNTTPILAQYGDDYWEVNEDGTLKTDKNGNYIRADKSKITQYYDAGKVTDRSQASALTKQNTKDAVNSVLTNTELMSELGKNADKEYWQKFMDEWNKTHK